ncbi:DUF4286 family protein [Mycobacterium sp. E1747]|uniref:DUF4286 family protein n=1 Tax=Mycobacterium sp. E1747 TaxID=1834128 RepID=UPI000801F026|nr:DUF4286 family protein [Mycobacterium sp. E1747]OBH11040.1 hypothetical protein A5695_20565 [Mycobacterium sp. E1747]
MPHAIMLAFTQPTSPESEEAFNDWYSNKHIRDLVTIPGVIAATRYEIAHDVETLPGVGGPEQKYLAIYEIEGETDADLESFAETLRNALTDGTADISVHLDMTRLGASLCLPLTERLERAATTETSPA